MERTDQQATQHSPHAHPAAAQAAVTRLGRAFLPRDVIRAVTRYETAAVHAGQLAERAETGPMSDLDADDLAHAEDLMAAAQTTLAAAGRLDLIGTTR